MTEYVINPMVFYWAEVSTVLKFFVIAFGVIGGIVSICCCISALEKIESECHETTDADFKALTKSKVSIALCVVVILAGAFIPTRKTLIQMSVAKLATVDNVDNVLETIDEKTDKLIDAINNRGDKSE